MPLFDWITTKLHGHGRRVQRPPLVSHARTAAVWSILRHLKEELNVFLTVDGLTSDNLFSAKACSALNRPHFCRGFSRQNDDGLRDRGTGLGRNPGHHYPAIGHSEKSPCPNLKKLGEPASTTAMMATFFPCLIAAIGWGRLTGIDFTGCRAVCLWNGHSEDHEIWVCGVEVAAALPPVPRIWDLTPFPVAFP